MRKLKTEKRFREQRKKDKAVIENLRENGMSEDDIAGYMHMMSVSGMIETAANDVVANKLKTMEILKKDEETKEEEKEDVQG